MQRDDTRPPAFYDASMAKKTTPPRAIGPDWFLPEWMGSLHVTQAQLARLCGWSRSRMNEIYHGETEYYRAIVNQIASALRIEPWELLMQPDLAMQIRRLRAAVDTEVQLRAAENRQDFTPADPPAERLRPRKAS